MNFKVGKVEEYAAPFPHYDPPAQIGCFSTDSENKFCDDDHQMKYLSMPKSLRNLQMDLNHGYSEYIDEYNDEEHSYNKLLRWIICHKEEVGSLLVPENSTQREIDFICRRGILTAINFTLYGKVRDWMIYATKFRSVIYLCQIDTERKIREEAFCNDRDRRWMSWGKKFPQYITSDSVDSKPDTSLPVNVNEKYFAVMKGKLKNHGILFSGEMDAVIPQFSAAEGLKTMNRFVEIKTSSRLSYANVENYFSIKMLTWYLQCFVAGVYRLVCGFRDNDGIVREMKMYNVSDFPKMVEGLWSPYAGLNFGSSFLSFVKQCVVKGDPKVVYKFYWKPGMSTVTCEELSPEYQFLPEWYISEISAL